MINLLKRALKIGVDNFLSQLGYQIANAEWNTRRTMEAAMQAIAGRKHSLKAVVDLGAPDEKTVGRIPQVVIPPSDIGLKYRDFQG